MNIKKYSIANDGSINIIIGMSHFIKTVDDLSEILATTLPSGKYAVSFCEASGPALVRHEGNDPELVKKAVEISKNIKAGHSFVVILKDCYPISVLSKIKMCDEVTSIFCASANPLTVLTVETKDGAGIIGVIDGIRPKGVETEENKKTRREFLKKIGYKF